MARSCAQFMLVRIVYTLNRPI